MSKLKNELAPYQERVSEAAGQDTQECPNVYMRINGLIPGPINYYSLLIKAEDKSPRKQ